MNGIVDLPLSGLFIYFIFVYIHLHIIICGYKLHITVMEKPGSLYVVYPLSHFENSTKPNP